MKFFGQFFMGFVLKTLIDYDQD
jgi:hypothetical protein